MLIKFFDQSYFLNPRHDLVCTGRGSNKESANPQIL